MLFRSSDAFGTFARLLATLPCNLPFVAQGIKMQGNLVEHILVKIALLLQPNDIIGVKGSNFLLHSSESNKQTRDTDEQTDRLTHLLTDRQRKGRQTDWQTS